MVPETDIADLLRRAPELMKDGAGLVSALKVTQFLQALFGKAADEAANHLAVEVRRWCFIRQLELFAKTKQMLEEAGLKPFAVPPKTLFPLLEGAALEEDDDLHSMFAALLANAATSERVRPLFVALLRQMSPDEAKLLLWISEFTSTIPVDVSDAPISEDVKGVCLDALESAQLIRRGDAFQLEYNYPTGQQNIGLEAGSSRAMRYADRLNKTYVVTDLGLAFLDACQPPEGDA